MTDPLHRIVIAGASVAGLSAADALRQGGYEGSITVLSEERVAPYDRPPLSKQMLSSAADSDPLDLRHPGHWYETAIDLRLGQAAAGLDIDRRYVITTNGEPLPWDALVIATGSRPRSALSNAGERLPTLRTVTDVQEIRRAALAHGRVTIIGSSFIGLEIAASLRSRGVEVTVFGATSLPLNDSVGPEVAADVRDLHRRHGVELRSGLTVCQIDGGPGDYILSLSDGSQHATPFVVAGIGVDLSTEWLQGSGVDLDEARGGVVCDAAGQASVPGVWAAGDVALYDHPTLGAGAHVGHWTNAMQQGRHVAANLLEGQTRPYAAVPYFWTDQYDRKLQCYGRRQPRDESFVAEGSIAEGEYLVLYGDGESLHAVLSCGRDRSLRPYRKLLQAGAGWSAAMAQAGLAPSASSS